MARLVIDQASSVTASTTNFNNVLSPTDNTVQKALDTLDNKVPVNIVEYSYGGF